MTAPDIRISPPFAGDLPWNAHTAIGAGLAKHSFLPVLAAQIALGISGCTRLATRNRPDLPGSFQTSRNLR
jgi:hypothetical protein